METGSSRVAIVTGGSRGIGRAIALRLAQDGLSVVVNYAGNEVAARKTVAAIHAAGGAAVASRGDVGTPEDVERIFTEARHAFGRVDVVVNSAGVMSLERIGDRRNPPLLGWVNLIWEYVSKRSIICARTGIGPASSQGRSSQPAGTARFTI